MRTRQSKPPFRFRVWVGIMIGVSASMHSVPTAAHAAIIPVGASQTYTTIQSGYAAASSGDTLLIDDGTYVFPSTINVNIPVTIQAVNVGGARLSGGGSGADDSIFFLSANATFSGLFFSNSNSGHAIYQRDTGAHGIIRNSIFTGIQSPIEINNSGGTAGSFDVMHTTIVGAGNGVNINDGGTITIRNSIIAHSGAAYAAHANISINPDHNLLFNNLALVGGGGTVLPDPAQIIADPMFVNAGAFDYRLSAGSPAIDSGLNLGFPFNGAAPDRGAYEFGATAVIVPEPSTVLVGALIVLFFVGCALRRLMPSQDWPSVLKIPINARVGN